MLTTVLILNGLITGFCWYFTWRIWRWQRRLARVTQALTMAERHTHNRLCHAPAAILQGQDNIQQLRSQYQQVLLQFQQLKQILALLGLGRFVYQLYTNRERNTRENARRNANHGSRPDKLAGNGDQMQGRGPFVKTAVKTAKPKLTL
ncbi:MAG: hypothetical protein EDM05_006225 [Leptolyngbya sp. IPPAS B-1204]